MARLRTDLVKPALWLIAATVALLAAVLGALAFYLLVRAQINWTEICRGGQDNPLFHSGECKDIEAVRVLLLGVLLTCALLPIAFFLFRRAARLRRA